MAISRSSKSAFTVALLQACTACAQDEFQWPTYRSLEYATPVASPVGTPTHAPPYFELSSLLGPRSTTTWDALGSTPTDHDVEYGNAAWLSLWEPIPVLAPPFTTTVSPTPIPSSELIKPPPLPLGPVDSGNGNGSLKFPKDFQWGFAGAALQIEGAIRNGGRGPSIWEDRSRGNYSGVGGGPPDIAAMNYYLYKQDIARLAAVGVQSYSFSISWSRILPFGLAGSPVNQEGIDHYNDVIDTVLEYGMKPVVTLHHFDTPVTLRTNTSFFSFDHPDFVDSFVYYAQTVLVHYSDRVGTWYTFNEPTIEANIAGNWQPSRHVLEAHARVVRWYREVIKGDALWSMKFDLSNTGFALPLDPANASDVAAAARRNEFTVGYFARPLFLGENVPQSMIDAVPDRVPSYTEQELQLFNGTADFFAFDIYTASYHSEPEGGFDACAADPEHPLFPHCTVPSNTRATWEANFYGNVDRVAVPSEHVRAILAFWQATYPTKGGITIAEYGLPAFKASDMSLRHMLNDIAQSNFYIPILQEVLKAINVDGVHVKGLYGWSYLDNWEWGQYDDKYGVQAYNQTTQERFYKRAIFDYAGFIQDHMDT
ncbi:Beta-glucosidase 1B [Colletotrichum spinosum]|uniref:Beta-glucosidase 1B n=1 Tax=Colletotrichum spinosum TaxID=1347390 RepID=A0A4R8QFG1_9PEZI|nr:Beta-glucosidase 1B [Colletotrichum spinosum]